MALLNLTRSLFVVLILFVGLFISCGPEPTRVIIRQGAPQQFVLSGRGTIEDLTITGPSNKCTQAWKQNRLPALEEYWRIEPTSETAVNRFSKETITYGQVPEGFRQTFPKTGSPPSICEGGPYNVNLAVRNGVSVNMFFAVYPDKIVSEGEMQ